MKYICRSCAKKHGLENIYSWDKMTAFVGHCDLYGFSSSCNATNEIVFPIDKFKYTGKVGFFQRLKSLFS